MTPVVEHEMRAPQRGVGRIALVVGALVAICAGGAMVMRAEAKTNKVALSSLAKRVTFVRAKGATYRASRSYVGTLRPWVEANVGPQLVSAYVDTVLVRPGAVVRRSDVLATLDCRDTSSASSAVAMQAHSLEVRQKALADEADRTRKMLDGGYASANEVEQSLAQSASEEAQLGAQRATLARTSLQVNDCVLRAPFDGEIGDRFVDPGTFARPGTAVVSVVDRHTVRFVADVPEGDFALVAPGTPVKIHVDASSQDIDGTIARRAPHADVEVRTIHFEVDIPNPTRDIPVDTTGEVSFDVGAAEEVVEVPLYAATVRGPRATVFVVEGNVVHARTVAVRGEVGSNLFLERALPAGSEIVTEGRALLNDGDSVEATEAVPAAPPTSSGSPTGAAP
jgi:membrane fusion protein, multidrug efflux system